MSGLRQMLGLITTYWRSRETILIKGKLLKREYTPLKSSVITNMLLFNVIEITLLFVLSHNPITSQEYHLHTCVFVYYQF